MAMLVPAVYFVSVALITFAALILTFVPAVYVVSLELISLVLLMVMFAPAVNLSCLSSKLDASALSASFSSTWDEV